MSDFCFDIMLPSVTVYWQDLGVTDVNANRDHLILFWDLKIQPWMDQRIQHDYNTHEAGVWFSNKSDAILFKITWAGKLLD